MYYVIQQIISSDSFLLLFDSFSVFFDDFSSNGDAVCYLLAWLAYIGGIYLVINVALRLLMFVFRGKI